MSLRARLTRPEGVICGVCAELADRAGIAPALIRLGAVLLTLCHPLAGLLLYAAIAVAWRTDLTGQSRETRRAGLERRFAAGKGRERA